MKSDIYTNIHTKKWLVDIDWSLSCRKIISQIDEKMKGNIGLLETGGLIHNNDLEMLNKLGKIFIEVYNENKDKTENELSIDWSLCRNSILKIIDKKYNRIGKYEGWGVLRSNNIEDLKKLGEILIEIYNKKEDIVADEL